MSRHNQQDQDIICILKGGISALLMQKEQMNVLSEHTVEEIFSLPEPVYKKEFDFGVIHTPLSTYRLNTLKRSQVCVACGIVGTIIRLEYSARKNQPHFNLYARDENGLVLMTNDHIIPAAKGGSNNPSNLQTMCLNCNNLKQHYKLAPNHIKDLMVSLRALIQKTSDYLSQSPEASCQPCT